MTLTVKMTSGDAENDTIEIVVLKNPHPEIIFLSLLEVTLVQSS